MRDQGAAAEKWKRLFVIAYPVEINGDIDGLTPIDFKDMKDRPALRGAGRPAMDPCIGKLPCVHHEIVPETCMEHLLKRQE